MKYRAGFVSNSSSSSFMGGIGVIKDWDKFDAWIEKLTNQGVDKYEMPKIVDLNSWDVIVDGAKHYSISLPVNDEPTVTVSREKAMTIIDDIPEWFRAKKLLVDGDFHNIAAFDFGNNEGDSLFWDGNDMQYDINLDWYSKNQQDIYNGFGEENGIVFVDKQFGAGRNG